MRHDPAHPRLAPTTHPGPRHSAYSTVCFHVSAYLAYLITEVSLMENITWETALSLALFIQLWVLLSCAVKARGYGPFSFSAILYCSCTTPQCLVKAWIWHLETATLNNYHIRFIHPKCIYVVWLCYKQQTNRELLTLSATAATQASIFLC